MTEGECRFEFPMCLVQFRTSLNHDLAFFKQANPVSIHTAVACWEKRTECKKNEL